MRHHVVLVPGFFAFGDLGELTYFAGVRDVLERAVADLQLEVEITEVKSLPTASIRKRAARVYETLAEVAVRHDDPIHLIGHSTGGLDARLAVAPTAQLETDIEFDAFERVHTLTTICAPHHGSPLATVLGSVMGKPLLRLLALAGHRVMRSRGRPLKLALALQHRWSRFDDRLGLHGTILDQINEQLLGDLTDERRDAILELLDGVSTDQALLFQLTSAGCDMLNASTGDPAGIRCGCVITRAARPRLRTIRTHGRDVFAQALHAVYAGMHAVASRAHPGSLPEPDGQQRAALERFYGEVPSSRHRPVHRRRDRARGARREPQAALAERATSHPLERL